VINSNHLFQKKKWWWACEPVYVLSNMSLKASISVFLLRLTPSVSQKAIIYTVLLVLQLYGAIYFLIFVLQCLPPKYFWEQYTGGKGSCMNPTITVKATYAYSAISCWADWTLAILPVFLIWGLQMNPRTKIVVGGILALGAMFVPLDYLFASLYLFLFPVLSFPPLTILPLHPLLTKEAEHQQQQSYGSRT